MYPVPSCTPPRTPPRTPSRSSPGPLAVIVPVRNEAEGIVAALDALAPLRQAGAELIVVDGGSRDATVALCQGRADQVLQASAGRARQMNVGAASASAPALLFLHADTTLPAMAMAQVQQALLQRAWGRFDVHIEGRSRWLGLVAWCMNRRSRLTGMATGDQALFMRRSAFEQVGGFPEQPLMEDIEISRRLLCQVGRPACLRAAVCTSGRRWDQHGAWRTIVLMWRLRLLYWLGVSAQRLSKAYR